MASTDPSIGEELADWGKVLLIETTGRHSGRAVTAAVGFVTEPDGSFLVAANDDTANWAQNLLADPRCRVTLGGERSERVAVLLDGPERFAAIVQLILTYGTPAERLGRGPTFRLVAG
jgi:deazaflavin-dependent oxidoreductase (nitroreductase family)